MFLWVSYLSCSWSSPPCMDRPVAVGSASGIAASVALALLKGFQSEAPLESLVSTLDCVCPSNFDFEAFPWVVFLLGVGTGLFLGPLLDVAWLVRQKWRRFVLRQAFYDPAPRTLHKVLAWTPETAFQPERNDLRLRWESWGVSWGGSHWGSTSKAISWVSWETEWVRSPVWLPAVW